MKVAVLNGSPKGEYSITLQTVLFIQKKFPNCQFNIINVGKSIRALEKDLSNALNVIYASDIILFSYPVYTFIAPYQLHRFIELLKESGADISGKFATQLTTSKHFYDVTAHKYIEENCNDLGLKYIKGLSADMDDLLVPSGQKDAIQFWEYVCFCYEEGLYEHTANAHEKQPEESVPIKGDKMDYSGISQPSNECNDTVIVTNCEPEDDRLTEMIAEFRKLYPHSTRVVNIREYPFKGGCLGCFNCAVTGKCIYKDNFDEFLRNDIQKAVALVYAFTIKDHSMGASFKCYDDRQFCNGHRTVTMGMPIGYLVNGDLSNEANLKMIIEGRSEVGHNYLAGIATDRAGIERLSKTLSFALKNKLVLPQNFYGVGGMKIFRDLIYVMRGMMRADHQFYKAHGMYDFPQKKRGTILKMKLVGKLLSSPAVKKKMGNRLNEGMIAPYKKVIDAK